MREYATPAGFRAAVEAALRERARRLGIPAYIIRRQAALERLVARLTNVAPDRWALKGGMALETRLGERARVSVDLDADHLHGVEAARADLQRAAVEDLGDHFGFAIAGSEELREAEKLRPPEQCGSRASQSGGAVIVPPRGFKKRWILTASTRIRSAG